jgi:hypothetical protein
MHLYAWLLRDDDSVMPVRRYIHPGFLMPPHLVEPESICLAEKLARIIYGQYSIMVDMLSQATGTTGRDATFSFQKMGP